MRSGRAMCANCGRYSVSLPINQTCLIMEAVATELKLPETLDALHEGEVLRIPAAWDEYLELADETAYNIQFLNNEIIIMSQATDLHEQLVIRLGKLFAIYFDELDAYRVLGSNVKIMIPDQTGDFNADLSVVRGASEFGPTPAGGTSKVRIKNPEIVVEILSKGTRKFDLGEKFTAYQTIPVLRHILLVDQRAINVIGCSRTAQPDQWLLTHYHNLNDVVRMDDFALPLADIYRNIDLTVKL